MNDDVPTEAGGGCADRPTPRVGLALGGGGARGLAHIGVLQVLEREGICVRYIAGSSMGGVIGALAAAGLGARDMREIARRFRFPRWHVPGSLLEWDHLFSAVTSALPDSFESLRTPLAVTAVDLETGRQVVLDRGPLLRALRATCAVPGLLPAVDMNGRWLIDGGVVNVLPVDVAWLGAPDVVVAVKVGSMRERRLPELRRPFAPLLYRIGAVVPNLLTAKLSFDILVRAAEIVLDHQTTLATAMTGPEVLITPEMPDISLPDFHRLDDAIEAGRRAADAVLPGLLRLLESPPSQPPLADRVRQLRLDPVCSMVISPARSRATTSYGGETYYFCSENCRDCFERAPDRYPDR